MHALDGIRGVNDFPYFGWIREERNDLLPLAPPHRHNRREFLAPIPLLKRIQRGGSGFSRSGLIDGFQGRRQILAVLPAR